MGKGDPKTRAKRNRQRWQAVALAPVKPSRPKRGADGRFAKPQEDETLTMLKARCRMVGLDPESREDRDAARAVQHVDDVGRCLIHYHHARKIGEMEKARLWTTWQGLCAAERTYRLRYLGTSGQPASGALTMLPEGMQTDTGHTVDLRTTEEKDRHAKDRWWHWSSLLDKLDAWDAARIMDALGGTSRALYVQGEPTTTGRDTISALRSLAKVAERC